VNEEILAGHLQELRRGTVVVACLSLLQSPQYGYSLLETLSKAGIEVDTNTLYPLLRRLEKQGLLRSEWNTEDARPRKFYSVSDDGKQLLERLLTEWRNLDKALESIAQGDNR